jgi:hypothetical protein
MFTGKSHNNQLLEEGDADYAHPTEPVFETTVASSGEREGLSLHVFVLG